MQTFGILGKRGSGKTTTASVFAEELLKANLPLVIVDPTGAWWGLRSSKDGKRDGFPITILGGDHGDVPLEETAGEEAPPLVLDLSALSKNAMWSCIFSPGGENDSFSLKRDLHGNRIQMVEEI